MNDENESCLLLLVVRANSFFSDKSSFSVLFLWDIHFPYYTYGISRHKLTQTSNIGVLVGQFVSKPLLVPSKHTPFA